MNPTQKVNAILGLWNIIISFGSTIVIYVLKLCKVIQCKLVWVFTPLLFPIAFILLLWALSGVIGGIEAVLEGCKERANK